jgi:RimJ/RimL family protein N-acetyltransferase
MRVFLKTERLMLRQLTAADVDHLVELDSDPEVMRFLTGGAPTPRQLIASDILPRFLRDYERYAAYDVWAAVEQASGDFVGWFGFRPREESRPDEVTLGHRLRRAASRADRGARGVASTSSVRLPSRRPHRRGCR